MSRPKKRFKRKKGHRKLKIATAVGSILVGAGLVVKGFTQKF